VAPSSVLSKSGSVVSQPQAVMDRYNEHFIDLFQHDDNISEDRPWLNIPVWAFKLISAIINKRKSILKENVKAFTDAQGGGRPGRTCGQKAQIINNVISHAIRHGIKLAILSFDVVKAYDKTPILLQDWTIHQSSTFLKPFIFLQMHGLMICLFWLKNIKLKKQLI